MKNLLTLFVALLSLSAHAKGGRYDNKEFNFTADAPRKWTLAAENIGPDKTQMIVGWNLPKVYSKLEKTDIENAVTVSAFRHDNVKSVDDLIFMEHMGNKESGLCNLINDTSNYNARFFTCMENGLVYKGKKYFVFKDGVGYIITFMATPGTYDINIPAFEEFFKQMKFAVD